MIGQSEDGGPLMQDAILAWNNALSDFRISPNRQTAAALFAAAGQYALDVGPLTPGMQDEVNGAGWLGAATPATTATAGAPSWLWFAIGAGVLLMTGNAKPTGRRRPSRRRRR